MTIGFGPVTCLVVAVSVVGGCTDIGDAWDAWEDADQTEIAIGAPTGEPCRPARQSGESGADSIVRSSRPPCRVVASLAFELSSPDGERPDPGTFMVVQDSRGRLYTGSGWTSPAGEVLVWAPDGTFLRSIGRLGEGPGEFPAALLAIYPGAMDSLYILSPGRLTVFDPDYNFVRATAAPAVNAVPWMATRLTSENTFLSVGGAWGAPADQRFHLATLTGEHVRSFGRRSPAAPANQYTRSRVAYGGAGTFWAVAEEPGHSAYILEKWSLDGTLLDRIRREAEWWTEHRRRAGTNVLVSGLHVDSEERVWVTLAVIESTDSLLTHHRTRYDVIAPRERILLASGALPRAESLSYSADPSPYPPFARFIAGTDRGARPVVDPETLIPRIEVFDLFLEAAR